jgi:hypothetical protein
VKHKGTKRFTTEHTERKTEKREEFSSQSTPTGRQRKPILEIIKLLIEFQEFLSSLSSSLCALW